ncbi:pyridine nucleotide-disulfide oxidoreductase domain-containing protein 1-like [Physella acuta]|uniref:pyridine nucleotide-disulfide oxidoreductase domain-containing protein 1-like n=1 Tax=Physella acuta TaxID=109671 RepID=UPI0027DC79DE|nr:pyridine nucleotide-disulfide oxidoreductase domain-containing protein 1-like [Physella acuta]
MTEKIKYVVIGGGIAGVTCAETLSLLAEEDSITLISASPLIKTVTNYVQLTRAVETFDVEEQPLSSMKAGVHIVHSAVTSLCAKNKKLFTADGNVYDYDKLCICTGGKPKKIAADNPYVVGIRDTESVKEFQSKIKSAQRIIIVGNGGIATELVYELEGCEVIWAIKDKSIAHTFVDAGAGEFFMEHVNKVKLRKPHEPSKRLKYTTDDAKSSSALGGVMGGALGPDWTNKLEIRGAQGISHRVHVESEVEVSQIFSPEQFKQQTVKETVPHNFSNETVEWPVYVCLSNGKVFGCDLIVSATGVIPFTDMFLSGNQFHLAKDGGLKVNGRMETSEVHVYAAGDVCTASWEHSPHWVQMRLWSQARQMGCYAAKCMVASVKSEEITMDFCFELFAHITSFFNFKVILLGRFNGQGLENNYEILLRVTKGEEYVKAILHEGKLVGAILIGETDMEETFENLILNGMDLTPFKDNLLEPGIDVEDFFD